MKHKYNLFNTGDCKSNPVYFRPSSYYNPTEKEGLVDYLKAVELRTLNNTQILEKQISELKENSRDNEYIIKVKLQEKKQIQELKKNDKVKEDALVHL